MSNGSGKIAGKTTGKPVALLLGATGLFGALLARRLLRKGRVDLVCAGRNERTLKAFCDENGGRFIRLDREDQSAVEQAMSDLTPFVVIDCAGPYQAYGDDPYRFSRTAIAAGCHYFDIADASGFVKGFETLDGLAKSKGVLALSGASTTPAISSCVADHLAEGLGDVESVTTVVIPGNRAKRTLSVMRSILSQIGQPMVIDRGGKKETVLGWSETESFDLEVAGKGRINGRLASFVDTPDIAFFKERYNARTVNFKAGLELKLFHYALCFGRWLVSVGVFKSLEPFSSPLRWIASWFERMGSDKGGMKVSMLGRTNAGNCELCEWDLIADDGHGPNIPTLPVSIVLNRLLEGNFTPGARVCMGEISMVELDEALAEFNGKGEFHAEIAKLESCA